MILEGLERIAIVEVLQLRPYLRARVRRLASERPLQDPAYSAVRANLLAAFDELVRASPMLPEELSVVARSLADDSAIADMIASALVESAPATRQDILATLNVRRRMEKLHELLLHEVEALKFRDQLRHEVQDRIAGAQKELFLREQLKAIRRELGEEPSGDRQLAELRTKIDEGGLPDDAHAEATRELDRLTEMPPGSPEASMVRSYVEWIAELPWQRTTATEVDLAHAHRILDEDHFGLEPVKDRILELLAVQRLRHSQRGPLICLVGPPGVGKTSVGRSIARATGREFVRISLGGTSDEAEIRGHRRTYIGAMPGQILRGLRRAGSRDPVFMLDEIDKLGRDFRGDPASALLEVLDPEQNGAFRDHYLDLPFDLSHVLFVATANVLDTISEPLRDRMEIIELPGYIDEDKLQIAQRYLIAKQIAEAGLPGLPFTPDAVLAMIRRLHARGRRPQARAAARERLSASARASSPRARTGRSSSTAASSRRCSARRSSAFESQVAERTRRPGVAVAVAWTPAGGDVLFVECSKLPHGRGEVTLTGQMGDVMQESARTAVSWVRAHAARYGIAEDALRSHDLHIHVPAGAVPKDGPSAGIVMVTALVSLLTNRPVEPFVALTGEVTLSGVVLPIGGIKEKVIAARRSGIRRLIVPIDNEPNLREEVPAHLRGDVEIRLVSTIEQALELAITPPGETTMGQQTVQDVMTKQVHCVGEGASVRQVAQLMRDQKIGDVLVTGATASCAASSPTATSS